MTTTTTNNNNNNNNNNKQRGVPRRVSFGENQTFHLVEQPSANSNTKSLSNHRSQLWYTRREQRSMKDECFTIAQQALFFGDSPVALDGHCTRGLERMMSTNGGRDLTYRQRSLVQHVVQLFHEQRQQQQSTSSSDNDQDQSSPPVATTSSCQEEALRHFYVVNTQSDRDAAACRGHKDEVAARKVHDEHVPPPYVSQMPKPALDLLKRSHRTQNQSLRRAVGGMYFNSAIAAKTA